MSGTRWQSLSSWYNAWLAAGPAERERLRRRLATEEPDLVADANRLVAASDELPGFLETPAFLIAASDMAALEAAPLQAGTAVGPYRVVGLVSREGVGDLYRATDPRLNRDVALRLMASSETDQPERVERFLHEVRRLVAIDHRHIVRTCDVGVFDGQPYVVSELLEGETLRVRLDKGALPINDVSRIAGHVAQALGCAHAFGVPHRDLAPEKILLTPLGEAKILDFGIAMLSHDAVASDAPTLHDVLVPPTGYLAPEQVLGAAGDARSDMFALGAIVFEMLSGERAFSRQRPAETLHAILHEPAPEVSRQRADTPAGLAAIVRRLLEKEPDARFQSAADLAWALERSTNEPQRHAAKNAGRARVGRSIRPLFAGVVGVVMLAVATGWLARPRPALEPVVPRLMRFTLALPLGLDLLSAPAVSPDGQRIAFVGGNLSGSRLLVRDLATDSPRVVAGSENAANPFWSPDGNWIGFFAGGRLMKAAVDDGSPIVVAQGTQECGAAWMPSGTLLYRHDVPGAGLLRVQERGGVPATATRLDSGDLFHCLPTALPDGLRFLYYLMSADPARRGMYLTQLDAPATTPARRLGTLNAQAIYVPIRSAADGVLLWATAGGVEAQSFDPARMAVGSLKRLDIVPAAHAPQGPAMLSATEDLLAYAMKQVPYGGTDERPPHEIGVVVGWRRWLR
jgi:eukaryotic-like serine/threonine-protein kinase